MLEGRLRMVVGLRVGGQFGIQGEGKVQSKESLKCDGVSLVSYVLRSVPAPPAGGRFAVFPSTGL